MVRDRNLCLGCSCIANRTHLSLHLCTNFLLTLGHVSLSPLHPLLVNLIDEVLKVRAGHVESSQVECLANKEQFSEVSVLDGRQEH